MHYPAEQGVEERATINPAHLSPRLLSAGHFHTKPGYATVRDRGTQDWLLFYTLGGAGRIVHLDGPLLTRPGDCVVLPPGLPHDYRIAPDCRQWEFLWTHFIPWPHWLGLLSWRAAHRGIKYLHVDDPQVHARVRAALERMVQYVSGPLRQRELFAMNALEEALLWLNSGNPELVEGRYDPRIRRAMEFMCANLERPLSLSQIGKDCGLSASRLSHLFRHHTGLTPVQYLEQQRMNRARELLDLTSFPVRTIAGMVGYSSAFYFSRRFSAFAGKSPREWRRGQD